MSLPDDYVNDLTSTGHLPPVCMCTDRVGQQLAFCLLDSAPTFISLGVTNGNWKRLCGRAPA